MTSNDVQQIIAQAVHLATNISTNTVIAVTDREGFVLGVWAVNTNSATDADIGLAIAKAGTAGFLSSGQHAFSTRTAGFIIMQHFPPILPLVKDLPNFNPVFVPTAFCSIFPNCRFPVPIGANNRGTGPLVGVQYSSLPFSDINFVKRIDGTPAPNPGSPFALDGTPGGVPLYKNSALVGGVGVSGDPNTLDPIDPLDFNFKGRDIDERIALSGQFGYAPSKKIFGSRVFIDGIRVPYVKGKAKKIDTNTVFFSASTVGGVVGGFSITNSPTISYPTNILSGVVGDFRFVVAGEVRSPIIADPLGRLSVTNVTDILAASAARSQITRARIRLPRNQPVQVFISVVNNPGTNGGTPKVLGTFRTPDATIFSWDVSVQKARTAVFFSDTNNTALFFGTNPLNIAMSTRTVGFLAQSLYPPGLEQTSPGPFHMFQEFVSSPTPTNTLHPQLTNGITIFPGGFPLYDTNGLLIGAIGISGDGVDEDEIVGASGAALFPPPNEIRADQFGFNGARLPYAKFPRDPDLDR